MLYILFLFLSAVKRHAIDAGSGCSQKTNPQHHIAAVPGLGAFYLLRRLALSVRVWLGRLGQPGQRGLSGWSGQSAQPDRWDLLE